MPVRNLPILQDSHGRWIRSLRVSLTDACNFRCSYCMPEKVQFEPSSALLNADELIQICRGLVDHGIRRIRLTGGEPLLRREFPEIVTALSTLRVEKLGLTTNGHRLEEHLPLLAKTRCRHLNVSVDSLRPDRFEAITRRPAFERVLRAVLRAKEMGFAVKVNAVLMRGTNDDEVVDFVRFSAEHRIPVRFLEYMKIGPQRHRWEQLFVAAEEVETRLREHYQLEPVRVDHDSTSFVFRTQDGAEIGLIASESRPFCANCSRLRLSAKGYLRACLMSEVGEGLRGVPHEQYPEILGRVAAMKPLTRLPELAEPMFTIGG